MKFSIPIIPLLFIFAVGCSKTDIVEQQPPNNPPPNNPPPDLPGDSASKIFFYGIGNTFDSTSLICYDGNYNRIWSHNGVRTVANWGRPLYENQTYYYTDNFTIKSANITTGAINWTYTDTRNLTNPSMSGDTLVAGYTTGALTNTHGIQLVNKNTGTGIWSMPIPDLPLTAPVLENGKIYVLATNNIGTTFNISCYDKATATVVWRTPLANSFLMTAPNDIIIKGDTIFSDAPNNNINAVNKITGALIWTGALSISGSGHLYKNSFVYYDDNYRRYKCISLANGNAVWETEQMIANRSSRNNDTLYCTSYDSAYKFSLSNGAIFHRQKINYNGWFERSISIGKRIYAVRNDPFSSSLKCAVFIINSNNFAIMDSIPVSRTYRQMSILGSNGVFYR